MKNEDWVDKQNEEYKEWREKNNTVKDASEYPQDKIQMGIAEVPVGSLILSPLSTKERCIEQYNEWIFETFEN